MKTIDYRRQEIISFAEDIFENPELGFKEERTSKVLAEKLEKLNLFVKRNLAVTGLKGYLKIDQRKQKNLIKDNEITIAIIAELDAIKSPFHHKADPITKAAHACGHHAQLAALLGAAIALSDSEVSKSLGGNVVFFAVPSEEYGEIEYKNALREQGIIELLGGKSELIRLGEFDDLDIVLSHHVSFGDERHRVVIRRGSSNGFVSKMVRYIGKEAHAAAAPDEGINALDAALIGLTAINAQRETFRDDDTVRIHSIITKGGDLVNVIPGEVKIETLVRGRTIEAIIDANAKATRAFKAGAYAVGAEVEIVDLPGYLPTLPNPNDSPISEIAKGLVGKDHLREESPEAHVAASTDIGDVSHLLPVFPFSTGGISGGAHSADFKVVDPEIAYILPAKIFALTVYQLLKNNAAQARKITSDFKPKLTKDDYLKFINSILQK